MKLLNKSLLFLTVSLFVIVGIWSVFFYFGMLSQIKESVDEGLDNYKRQIVFRAQSDSTLLNQSNFEAGFFTIHEIPETIALEIRDAYIDTMMYMQDADDILPELEPVRILTTAFEQDGKFYKLRIINSMVEESDLIKELFIDILILYFVLIVGLVLINNIVLKKLWQPFYALLSQLKNYKIGNTKQVPQSASNIKAFKDLQQAVAILLQHNNETYERQKQFIGNASHELQTPLAIAINKLELLIEKGSLSNDQAEQVAAIMQVVDRMVRLNKSLLLLSKIENNQFLNNEKVVFNAIVQQIIADFEDFANYKSVTIHFTPSEEVVVDMDKSLATIIVTNLLKNAIVHNIENGEINVKLNSSVLEVSNSGVTTPMDNQIVFSRFYKFDNHSNGSGLGLAIVKAICDMYQFKVDYQYKENLHFFSIRF